MDGFRVVDTGADAALVQAVQHCIPFGNSHDVQVPHVLVARQDLWQAHPVEVSQKGVVAGGSLAPSLVPGIQTSQFRGQHHRLDRVQPRVEAHHLVFVLALTAVVGEQACRPRELRVVGHQRTRVTGGAQVLAGVEARGRSQGQGTCSGAVASRALRLGGILEDHDGRSLDGLGDVLNGGRLAEEVDREHGPVRPVTAEATRSGSIRR